MAFGQQLPEQKYEYLDHTADVQLHSWGDNLTEAFEQVAMAMFGYMTTNYDTVEMTDEFEVEAEGEDMMSLLFHFLDEWLFVFSADPFFIPRKVVITEFDNVNFRIKSKGYGETFDIQKHPQGGREGIRLLASYILFSNDYSEIQGTEVKAITYSNMQIYDNDEMHEVFVIIDI